MTAMTNLEELKTKQQKMWSSGDYGKVAWLTVPLAEQLCESIQLRPGSTVLDVATGTGHVALAAARRFCHTTGIDYVPALVEVAEARAAAEGLDIDYRVADAENLPFSDASFDFVMSAIGVMFTADHERAARELTRVCRPEGRIGLASWTPTGFVGQLLKTVGKHVPPPPGAKPPTRWGSEDGIRELLGDQSSELHLSTTTATQRFLSPEHFADFFVTQYGPTLKASEQLSDDGKQAFRADLIALANDANRANDGTLVCDWDYLVAVATRR
ncbi:MAG TPA: methyltransferase domain-containing protein [Nocardioidaceae bacterium]|nr:methyltransferase domain-containing protein [Nocardioidaceae bacterium]